jgi:hypothetical protein
MVIVVEVLVVLLVIHKTQYNVVLPTHRVLEMLLVDVLLIHYMDHLLVFGVLMMEKIVTTNPNVKK